jgi:hypothetical protein
MAELERRGQSLSQEMRRIRDQDNPAPEIHFMPAAGFSKPTL